MEKGQLIGKDDALDIVNDFICMSEDWTNQWAYQSGYEKIMQEKQYALLYKKEIRRWGFDVEDVYKQLEEFEKCVSTISTITGTREEAIILSAVKYAQNGKTIVYRRWLPEKKRADTFFMADKNLFLDKLLFDTQLNLFYFYIRNKTNFLCLQYLDTNLTKFLDARENYIQLHRNDKLDFYCLPLVISYCKILVKQKKFDKAKILLDTYTFEAIGKTDNTNFEKIKEKIYKEKNND